MKLDIPQIPTQQRGKNYTDENYLYHNFSYSPKYGSLLMKHADYNERHFFMNELLKKAFILHHQIISCNGRIEIYSFQNSHTRMLFLIETIIYWVRKNADEMIAFNYYADYFTTHDHEPVKLQISSIGSLMNEKNHPLQVVFQSHLTQLDRINEISNSYKHSFINSEAHRLYGETEPVVNCLDMRRNDTQSNPVFHSYYLREIINDYISFFFASRDNLKRFKLPPSTSDREADVLQEPIG